MICATPGFIGIGVQKSATTWIYDNLHDHPEVCVSEVKEINFFSHHYDHGFQWYERHFAPSDRTQIRGEISPSYFYEPAVPERIARYAPTVKLLLVLRDPVERAISNHKHEVRERHFMGPDLDFESGLANNPTYVEQGLYATHLRRWLQFFPREQIHIVLFEDVVNDPMRVAIGVFRFLGIDESHVSKALNEASNAGHINRSPQLHEARRRLRLAIAGAGLGRAWEGLARLGLRKVYREYNRLPSEALVPPVSEETRRALRRRFDGEIKELEQLVGCNLAAWRAPEIPESAADGDVPKLLKPLASG